MLKLTLGFYASINFDNEKNNKNNILVIRDPN